MIIELSRTKYLNGDPCSGSPVPLAYFNRDFSSSRENNDSGPQGGGKAPWSNEKCITELFKNKIRGKEINVFKENIQIPALIDDGMVQVQ